MSGAIKYDSYLRALPFSVFSIKVFTFSPHPDLIYLFDKFNMPKSFWMLVELEGTVRV
jgi:hypothetical protein